jgi:hypothetical protein
MVAGAWRIRSGGAWRSWLGSKVPAIGFVLAVALIVSRRPDAVTHAQLWAEDGRLFFADVYNRGFLATLLVPQSGYFQTLPVLVSGLARLLPLAWAPLAMNLAAIAVRALPVALLLGARARTISPDRRIRALLAALYIALPGLPEADGNIDNALWYLAVAAIIVLMRAPPVRRRGRLSDGAILLACATTGVFSIILAPLAIAYRRWRPDRVPWSSVAILSAGAALQLTSLIILQYHLPRGFNAAPRVSVPLGASPQLFLQLLGGRVILPAVFGDSVSFTEGAGLLAGSAGVLAFVLAFRRAGAELRLFLAFAALQFVMALAHPQGVSWPQMTLASNSGRYFIIPGLAVAATLVWACAPARGPLIRPVTIGLLLFAAVVTIPTEWSYPAYKRTNFASKATTFEHSPPGTTTEFALNPNGWSMTLIRR